MLPATTAYERHDIGRAEGDSYLFDMPALITAVGQARDDYDIFAGLAERLGVGEMFTEGRSSEQWLRFLYEDFRSQSLQQDVEVPTFEELQETNWVDLPLRDAKFSETPFADFREDPEANPLSTPSGKIEIFSSTIDSFAYADCPGHPTWLPPTEWLGAETTKDFPLHLVSPQPGDKLHSQLESAIADIPGERPTPITINPEDAAQRSITDASTVRVFSPRGACLAKARISVDIMPGVVSLPTGAWFTTDKQGLETQGNPNTLTRDTGTSQLGQGSSAHSCLVEIEKVTQRS